MAPTEPLTRVPTPLADTVHTVIFVDVDGVLNVGARDTCGPVLINRRNIKAAKLATTVAEDSEVCANASRVLAVCNHQVEGGKIASYSANEFGFSETLVGNLAELISSISPTPQVVLASSWRHLKYRRHADLLQAAVGKKLGREFSWDDMTPIREESCARERLRTIATYIRNMTVAEDATEVRMLVLDDFFITPFDGWSCQGMSMTSAEMAERYLLKHSRSPTPVAVKVVHPYEEILAGHCQVRAATGLAHGHLKAASAFLLGGGGSRRPAKGRPGLLAKAGRGLVGLVRCGAKTAVLD